MKIWTVTYNDDYGSPNSDVFTTKAEAEAAERNWLQDYQHSYPDIDYTNSNEGIFMALCECDSFIDSVTIQEHEIALPKMTRNLLEEIYFEEARNQGRDGELEFDDDALVSRGEDAGAYVQGWTWISDQDVEQDMVLIEESGTVWYFDIFEEFLEALGGTNEVEVTVERGTPELLKKSEGVNDAWEFLTRGDR